MADKGHGVKLEGLELSQLLELKEDLGTELYARFSAEESRFLALKKSLGMDETAAAAPAASGEKRGRASKEEMDLRVNAVLNALRGTTRTNGKAMSKSEILGAAGLPASAWIGLSTKLKKEGLIDSEGSRINAVWFLAEEKKTTEATEIKPKAEPKKGKLTTKRAG